MIILSTELKNEYNSIEVKYLKYPIINSFISETNIGELEADCINFFFKLIYLVRSTDYISTK